MHRQCLIFNIHIVIPSLELLSNSHIASGDLSRIIFHDKTAFFTFTVRTTVVRVGQKYFSSGLFVNGGAVYMVLLGRALDDTFFSKQHYICNLTRIIKLVSIICV